MFTVDQIKAAHRKVKSGVDFPNYIKDIKQLGVTAFETWVKDSHTEYRGADGYKTISTPQYPDLTIAHQGNKDKFSEYLQQHQLEQTDYFAFCNHCAETGIEKWIVSLDSMTCTYYDLAGNAILTEPIPN